MLAQRHGVELQDGTTHQCMKLPEQQVGHCRQADKVANLCHCCNSE
jgi:hypothetical protein